MDIKQAIGARIRELRHKKGLTQEEFAELVNVAPRHISRIENGVNTPSIEALERIAKVFNLEVKDLCNFQHLYDEEFLRKSINEIIDNLNAEELSSAFKLLNAMFN